MRVLKPTRTYMDAKSSRAVRLPEVMKITALGRSTIYALIKDGSFPPGFKLSARARAWREVDVHDWLEGKQKGAISGE